MRQLQSSKMRFLKGYFQFYSLSQEESDCNKERMAFNISEGDNKKNWVINLE